MLVGPFTAHLVRINLTNIQAKTVMLLTREHNTHL